MPTPNEPFIKDLRKVETLLFFANPSGLKLPATAGFLGDLTMFLLKNAV